MITLNSFTLYRCDRRGRRGSGVAFYLINLLNAKILEQSTFIKELRKPKYIIAKINFTCVSKLFLIVISHQIVLICRNLKSFFWDYTPDIDMLRYLTTLMRTWWWMNTIIDNCKILFRLLTCKGSFNKDSRFLKVNKTSCVWDIHSIFFYLKEYFMALSMEYTSLNCPRLRLVTRIRTVQFSMTFSHKSGWICWMAFVMLTLRASIVCGLFI